MQWVEQWDAHTVHTHIHSSCLSYQIPFLKESRRLKGDTFSVCKSSGSPSGQLVRSEKKTRKWDVNSGTKRPAKKCSEGKQTERCFTSCSRSRIWIRNWKARKENWEAIVMRTHVLLKHDCCCSILWVCDHRMDNKSRRQKSVRGEREDTQVSFHSGVCLWRTITTKVKGKC